MNMLKLAAAAAAITFASSVALAEPVKMTKAQMDDIVAGAITKTNGGGNTPAGQANGIPNTNPAGKEPAGQNK